MDTPCLSLARLLELRAFVDSFEPLAREKRSPSKEVPMTRRRMFPQPDLFEPPPPRIVLAPAQRTKLVEQPEGAADGGHGRPGSGQAPRHIDRRRSMTKITPDHLARGAFVYVRQSTAMQVTHNSESQRRQYALADRARQLGWQDVDVIDDDLGRSGGGIRRPGFGEAAGGTREGRVGAVCPSILAWPCTGATGTRCWSSGGRHSDHRRGRCV